MRENFPTHFVRPVLPRHQSQTKAILKKKKKKTTEEEEEKPGCACGDRMVLYLDSSNVSHFVVALYYSFTRKLYLEKLWLGTLGGQDSGYTGSLHRVSFFLFFFRNYLFLSF